MWYWKGREQDVKYRHFLHQPLAVSLTASSLTSVPLTFKPLYVGSQADF